MKKVQIDEAINEMQKGNILVPASIFHIKKSVERCPYFTIQSNNIYEVQNGFATKVDNFLQTYFERVFYVFDYLPKSIKTKPTIQKVHKEEKRSRENTTQITDVPQEVTIEMIDELRARGKKYAAWILLQQYHEQGEKNKKQLQREIKNKENKKINVLCKKYGICRQCQTRELDSKNKMCSICLKKYEKYRKKYKKLSTIIFHLCDRCNQVQTKLPTKYCPECRIMVTKELQEKKNRKSKERYKKRKELKMSSHDKNNRKR